LTLFPRFSGLRTLVFASIEPTRERGAPDYERPWSGAQHSPRAPCSKQWNPPMSDSYPKSASLTDQLVRRLPFTIRGQVKIRDEECKGLLLVIGMETKNRRLSNIFSNIKDDALTLCRRPASRHGSPVYSCRLPRSWYGDVSAAVIGPFVRHRRASGRVGLACPIEAGQSGKAQRVCRTSTRCRHS
jgi:hypothetical protein